MADKMTRVTVGVTGWLAAVPHITSPCTFKLGPWESSLTLTWEGVFRQDIADGALAQLLQMGVLATA